MVQTERTLAFDNGGSAIRRQVVDPSGEPIGAHKSRSTPRPATPQVEGLRAPRDVRLVSSSVGLHGCAPLRDCKKAPSSWKLG